MLCIAFMQYLCPISWAISHRKFKFNKKIYLSISGRDSLELTNWWYKHTLPFSCLCSLFSILSSQETFDGGQWNWHSEKDIGVHSTSGGASGRYSAQLLSKNKGTHP